MKISAKLHLLSCRYHLILDCLSCRSGLCMKLSGREYEKVGRLSKTILPVCLPSLAREFPRVREYGMKKFILSTFMTLSLLAMSGSAFAADTVMGVSASIVRTVTHYCNPRHRHYHEWHHIGEGYISYHADEDGSCHWTVTREDWEDSSNYDDEGNSGQPRMNCDNSGINYDVIFDASGFWANGALLVPDGHSGEHYTSTCGITAMYY